MVHTLKQYIKYTISYLLFVTGILRLYQRRQLKHTLTVLMYHRVLKDHELPNSFSNRGIIVNDKTFDAHVRHLKKHFHVISIDELLTHLRDRTPFMDCSCLITFDDGWIDNYINALPILNNHDAPALIFLPTNYIGSNQPFWQETLAACIYQIMDSPGDHRHFLQEQGVPECGSLQDHDQRHVVDEYLSSLKKQSNDQIDAVIEAFKTYIMTHQIQQPTANIDRYIDWEQIQTMNNHGVSFGSHAKSHRLLTKLSNDQIKHELIESKHIIASRLNKSVQSIAYPNGDFNDTVINYAENCGYQAGFSTNHGYFRIGDNPYTIKRINIHQSATANTPMFLCRLLGIF